MMGDTQFWGDPSIQFFRLYDSSELKHISGEEKEPGFPNSRNQVMINEGNISVGYELYLDTYCMVQVAKTF